MSKETIMTENRWKSTRKKQSQQWKDIDKKKLPERAKTQGNKQHCESMEALKRVCGEFFAGKIFVGNVFIGMAKILCFFLPLLAGIFSL
jgi:hypothetical protein